MTKKQIQELKDQVSQLTNNWKKALADYQNLEKQMVLAQKQWVDFSNQQLICKLLPVYDNLRQLVKHLPDKGLQLTFEEFKKILQSEGLEEIQIIDDKTAFDAKSMDCVETCLGQDCTIVKTCQPGFLLKGKLIRPAKVVVGKKDYPKN